MAPAYHRIPSIPFPSGVTRQNRDFHRLSPTRANLHLAFLHYARARPVPTTKTPSLSQQRVQNGAHPLYPIRYPFMLASVLIYTSRVLFPAVFTKISSSLSGARLITERVIRRAAFRRCCDATPSLPSPSRQRRDSGTPSSGCFLVVFDVAAWTRARSAEFWTRERWVRIGWREIIEWGFPDV